jgi:hypothetical protein
MRWQTTTLCAAIVLSLLAVELRVQAAPPSTDGKQNESTLVLLSGEVIQGEVSQLDDRYLVVLPTGRIFVPVSNVEIVCRNLTEAYGFRRSQMGQGQAQDHAELAQWCQRHGLDAAAEEQLHIARRLDPNHPIIGLVERRLVVSKRSAKPPEARSTEGAATEPTPQQLADFASGLPHGTVEAFTRVVQPLLINRCATAGCHSDRSDNEFRLERSRPGTPLGQTSTHRNLLATLKLVDSVAPDQCELLRPKKCPHRLRTDTALSLSKTGQYRFLVAWVSLLAQRSAGLASAPVAARQDLPDTIRTGPPGSTGLASASADGESPAEQITTAIKTTAIPTIDEFVVPAAHVQSADPFDPVLFNGRYGTSPPSNSAPERDEKVPVPSPFFPG